MQPLYTEQEFESAKSRQTLPLRCLHCTKIFHRTKHSIQVTLLPHRTNTNDFCSKRCKNQHFWTGHSHTTLCKQCSKSFNKQQYRIVNTKHNFCSQSCAAKYNNAHKTKGTRVSKLEKWLAIKLPEFYPNLEFHFNRKDAINGELDIFIPSLKLAFELNGIFHYEPIYGSDKLTSTQTNDCRKMLACAEYGISLCVIDVSHQLYFKEQTSMKFLQIIQNIINAKLSGSLPVIATVA